MKLLGKNLATVKKELGRKFTIEIAINLLVSEFIIFHFI